MLSHPESQSPPLQVVVAAVSDGLMVGILSPGRVLFRAHHWGGYNVIFDGCNILCLLKQTIDMVQYFFTNGLATASSGDLLIPRVMHLDPKPQTLNSISSLAATSPSLPEGMAP